MGTTKTNWTKSSWHNFTALQQPKWPDKEVYEGVLADLSRLPPLVFAGEIRELKAMLAKAVVVMPFCCRAGIVPRTFPR